MNERSVAQEQLNAAVKEAEAAVSKACAIADEHGLQFYMMNHAYVGNDNGKRLTVEDYWDGIYYGDLDEDDERYNGDEYAGWQNSSTFC